MISEVVTMSDNEDSSDVTSANLRKKIAAILKKSYTSSFILGIQGNQVHSRIMGTYECV